MVIFILDHYEDQEATLLSGVRRDTLAHGMRARVAIIFVLLIVAFDLTFNNASWLKAIVGYANALMWKIGPI